MSYLALDIETVPLARSLNIEYNPDDNAPPTNYKSDEAIAKHHERGAKDFKYRHAKACSVNPRLGRVLCIDTNLGAFYATTEADERSLLHGFWALAQQAGGNLVSWNGKAFDVPFLVLRSVALDVKPSCTQYIRAQWTRKYGTEHHFDVKEVLLRGDNMVKAGEGLDEWAAFFDLPAKPDGIDGSSVAFLHSEEQHGAIAEYCRHDRVTTEAMYDRMRPYFGGF